MSAWSSPRTLAINELAKGVARENAAVVVDLVIDRFSDPDRDMLEAGLAALREFVHASPTNQQRIVETIWRRMMDRARQ